MIAKRCICLLLALLLPVAWIGCRHTAETETADGAENEAETQTEEIALTVATYNIKIAGQGEDNVAAVIREMGADIVGLQEVDYLTKRSGKRDQPALIAAAAEMPYYRFTHATDYSGGQYGTLILSKYPILQYETILLESGEYEQRAVGHAVLDVNGTSVDYFNTHLSYEDKETRSTQFVTLAVLLSRCKHWVLTADFNTEDMSEFAGLGAKLMINRADRKMTTFPGKNRAIDNILCSAGFAEVSAGTVTNSYSDHYALWAKLTFRP